MFSFSFDPNAEESRRIAGGLIWVAFLFAAVVALNQTWAREIRNQVLDAYRVSPCAGKFTVSRKGVWEFHFCFRAGSRNDTAVCDVLSIAAFGIMVATRTGGGSWDMGFGREWDVFCGDVATNSQPRDHASAPIIPNFDTSAPGALVSKLGMIGAEA